MSEVVAELETQALSIPEQAKALTIVDPASYEKAGGVLVVIKGLRKRIDETFDPIISKAFAAHKEAKAQKTKVEAPLVVAEDYLKPLMARYNADQEKKRREEEAKAQAEARKKAEDEQQARALAAEQRGDHKKAEAIISQPVVVAPVIIPKETPKVAGVSFRQTWKARVVDETLVPREYLCVDTVKLNGYARSMKGSAMVAGVEFYSEDVVSAGAGSSAY